MTNIISVSRRTDIPAFYSDWFVNRLSAGFAEVRQPYSGKLQRVSLTPADVGAVVFWSKNYSPLLSKLDTIEKTTKNLFFHFTITANVELEPDVPDYRDAIKDLIFLSRRYSPKQLVWRYDPLCITDQLSYELHEERFVRCADLLKGKVGKCYISFVHPYKKVLRNMQKYSTHVLQELSEEQKREHALRLASRAGAFGITLYACCNNYLLSETVMKASCIDGGYLSELFNVSFDTKPAFPRKECACTRSIDIGAYDTCAHGCLYCYANADKSRARSAWQRHDPDGTSLSMNVDSEVAEELDHQQVLPLLGI